MGFLFWAVVDMLETLAPAAPLRVVRSAVRWGMSRLALLVWLNIHQH